MNFLSGEFLIFLPVALLLWWGTIRHEPARVALMVVASLVFYGHDHGWFVLVILAYCLVDWTVGRLLEVRPRRAVLMAGIAFNLAVLAIWKYTPLALETIASLAGAPLPDWTQAAVTGWVLPLGVSFYAFSGIAYMVDVHRGAARAEPSLARYALFTVFFPHLVAGPILRAGEFLTDLAPGRLPIRPTALFEGALLIARGVFRKAVLGDGIAVAIDPYFAHAGQDPVAGVWALPFLYLYALQIYFDFAGYTDIARGLGLWFGFRWPENFDRPYLAASVRDFWRRWHMTLSRFLRDYLYIPLGGSRRGAIGTAMALLATMGLGGLWHGASWSFLVWGLLHGLYLLIHRIWSSSAAGRWLAAHGGTPWRLFSVALTFHAVVLAWAFFRIADIGDAWACVVSVFRFDPALAFSGGSGDSALWMLLAVYGAAAFALHRLSPGSIALPTANLSFRRGATWGATAGLLLLGWLLAPGGETPPFIYFQF